MMGRCVIVGGADINNYSSIREKLCTDDYVIFCDSGLKHLEQLQAKPNLIVGDFDSHENPHLEVETTVLPCEKDDTDIVYAVKEAMKRGFDNFLLIGIVRARLNHTLGNVSILLYLNFLGKKGCIIAMSLTLELQIFISERNRCLQLFLLCLCYTKKLRLFLIMKKDVIRNEVFSKTCHIGYGKDKC